MEKENETSVPEETSHLSETDSIMDKEGLDHEVADNELGVETDNPVDLGIDPLLDDEYAPAQEIIASPEDKVAIIDEEVFEGEE